MEKQKKKCWDAGILNTGINSKLNIKNSIANAIVPLNP
jgi:hypothetical protein